MSLTQHSDSCECQTSNPLTPSLMLDQTSHCALHVIDCLSVITYTSFWFCSNKALISSKTCLTLSSCKTYMYSKNCLERPIKNTQNKGLKDRWYLNAGRKYCRMLSWSISGAFCNTFDQHYGIIRLEKHFLSFFGWPIKTGFTVPNVL